MGFLYFWLKTKILKIECWVLRWFCFKKTREKQKLDFFLNEKHTLWFWDCSMSGFPKGFRISKAKLVNVFLEKVFFMQHAMQCKGETNNMVCNATRGG